MAVYLIWELVEKKDKLATKFDQALCKVIGVKGSMVTAIQNDR